MVPDDCRPWPTDGWADERVAGFDVVEYPTMCAGKNDNVLVIVESPSKAKTIAKYLGPGFTVESSVGHIRDLPSRAAEIPATHKNEAWARLGVDVDNNFEPLYIIPAAKKAQVKKLRDMIKKASALYLATDEDREGEAIAWHLIQVLKPKCPVKRMVFDEITKKAIANAVENTREIDQRLVNAQETRRIIDRLFGYEVSPVLWRKVKPKLSAGRVQSVATRLIVERESERKRFVQSEYWDIEARLGVRANGTEQLDTKLIELGGKRVAIGKDFDETSGKLKGDHDVVLLDGDTAKTVASGLQSAEFTVANVTEKPFTSRPQAPFITSTLQQESARKLRFSAKRTMRVAQSLYENGFITYMRTDSTNLSSEALNAARSQVTELYGKDFLPKQPRAYTRKAKNAQEAHEAIRPAGDAFRLPKKLEAELDGDAFRLYELIWKRTVASQMMDAHGMRTAVRIEAPTESRGTAALAVSGKVIKFTGYLRAYVEGSDDPDAELEDQEKILPPLQVGQTLDPKHVEPIQHFTQPPARFTEASLIRELEARGIGRPSTYAAIIQTIQDRGYVWRKGTALVPTFTAFAVTNLLSRHMASLVDYDFTAKMEGSLDAIANGELDSAPWLHDFYFGEPNGKKNGDHVREVGLKALVESCGENIDPRTVSGIPLGTTPDGEEIVARVGRYGPYVQIGDSDQRASIPDDIPPDSLDVEKALELLEQAAKGDQVLGNDPATSQPVYLKTGRFGPYIQLGDPELTEKGTVKKGTAPKRASLWPTMSIDTVSLDDALLLLSFPREVGVHPETAEPIVVQDGRYGPYLKSGTDTRSLTDHEKLVTLTLAEAVELLKQPKTRGRSASSVIAELGAHPSSGDNVVVKNGRYGPYVTDGVVNATIPKSKDPESVTLEDAVALIAAREEKMRDQGKDPRATKTKRTTTRKKTAKKKVAAKKTAKKKTATAKPAVPTTAKKSSSRRAKSAAGA